jgi:hypothetical protein
MLVLSFEANAWRRATAFGDTLLRVRADLYLVDAGLGSGRLPLGQARRRER